jgi:hypothetical protein
MKASTIDQNLPRSARGDRPTSLLYRFEARLDFVPIGLVPEGFRLVLSFEGAVTEGDFVGARVWGTDHLLLRRDGVGVIDAPKTISTSSGQLFEHLRGYCLPPEGMTLPPLEALLSSDFSWPDALFPIQGFSTFRAGSPELSYLNRALATVDGWSNLSTGRLAVETRLIEHYSSVAPPKEL